MDQSDQPLFAALLRTHRIAAGLSQEALAESAGVSAPGVSKLERGLIRAPHPATIARLADALRLEAPARAALAAAARPAVRTARQGVPAYRTDLIGRQLELAQVRALFQNGARLITLVGPGGVGKTRLAAAAADEVEPLFPDGAKFASLAALVDPGAIPAAVADALGLAEDPRRSVVEGAALALQGRRVLLALDNFEHLLSAATLVSELLNRCAGLHVLVTSRTPLALEGESILPIGPLAVPDPNAPEETDLERPPAAVELFVRRAQAVQPGFALSPANVADVVAICRDVDGLPLALELAAARMSMFTPAALRARLDRPLSLLTGGRRDAPARHATLRAAIAWSYDLLTPVQQHVLRRLAVFAGGWTIEMARTVCNDVPQAATEQQMFDALDTLVGHSLVQVQDPSGSPDEPRFAFLSTIRDFARELLDLNEETTSARRRHAEAMLALAEHAEPKLISADRPRWLNRLTLELENIRAALAWSTTPDGDAELGASIAGSLGWFWYLRGHLAEGRQWLERVLAQTATTEPAPGRARALLVAGAHAIVQGEPTVALAYEEECVALYRRLGDERRLAQALTLLGLALANAGQPAAALERYTEATELADQLGASWWAAYALVNTGDAKQLSGDARGAAASYRASLARFERIDDDFGLSIAQNALAGLEVSEGHMRAARALYTASVDSFRRMGDPRGLAQTLLGLGDAALIDGDVSAARTAFVEALGCWQRLGIELGLRLSVRGLARVAEARGDLERAVRLYAAASTQTRVVGVIYAHADENADDVLSGLQARMDQGQFESAFAAGRAMTLLQSIADAAVD